MNEPLQNTLVYDWIAHHAAYWPGRPAAIDANSGRRFTYAAFHDRVSRLAGFMRDTWQIGQGDRVAVLAMNCTEYFEIQFACTRLGAVLVPLNWRLALPELEYITGDCTPEALFCDPTHAATAAKLQRNKKVLQIDFGEKKRGNYEAALAEARPIPEPVVALTHAELSAILYTSGTTGRPKGAMITHGMTFWNAVNIGMAVGLTYKSTTYNVLPAFHTGGLNLYANPTFHTGGTAIIARHFEPEEALRWLGSGEVTHFFGVPTIYLMLRDASEFAKTDLSGVQSWASGGAPLPVSLIHEYGQRGIVIRQGCGMTETSPTVFLIDEEHALEKAGSVGKPVLHTEVRIVSREGREVAAGETGELCIRGPNITPGYWQNPEATAAALRDGWLHSGDAARIDEDGFYYIVDRWKDMYISGGENVYPAEVEQVIYQLPAVAECAVIGIPDAKWGEVGKAFIVLKPGQALSESQVIDHCRKHLARYKIPKVVAFVPELPHTAAGKILKTELRNRESRIEQ